MSGLMADCSVAILVVLMANISAEGVSDTLITSRSAIFIWISVPCGYAAPKKNAGQVSGERDFLMYLFLMTPVCFFPG